ncbi:MAG: 3-phosphoshikimate 1-carboxyvinyltransferase, partial [Planctomycetota bacterium]
ELVAPVSSQELSALLIALAAFPGHNRVRVRGALPSAPYVALTRACVEPFGASIEVAAEDGGDVYEVHGPLLAPAQPLAVEPDASAAAVALAAVAIGGGAGRVDGLTEHSAQGDRRFVEHARAFGCAAGFDAAGAWIEGAPTRGARLDLAGEPDLAPVAASLAAAVALRARERELGTSLLTGLATLRGKESDRIACLARGLARLGLSVGHGPDFLRIAPGDAAASSDARVLDPLGDHRMAFAFALCSLAAPRVYVADPGCVSKSWPSFWRDLAKCGARVETHALEA